MSIGIPGLSSLPGGIGPLGGSNRPGGSRAADVATTESNGRSRSEEAAPARTSPASDVPPGTDPELWAVLTTEERAHFTRLRSMGPLTYNTSSNADAPARSQARRGVRLDIRA